MTLLLTTALLASSACPAAGHRAAVGPALPPLEALHATLTPRAIRTWSLQLPGNAYHKISGSLPIVHDGGRGFAVEAQGNGLRVDTDGDGELDRVVEGREHPETKVRHARITLSGKRGGVPFRHAVRLELQAQGWAYASSSIMEGAIGGTAIQLIDMNGNGSFTDVGKDAVAVDGSQMAQLLGESLLTGRGTLLTVGCASVGSTVEMTATTFAGDSGTLDLRSEFGSKGVMLGAVVQSADQKHSFELSGAESGARVPVGRYRLVSAAIGLGDARATVDPALMRTIEVRSDETTAVRWGAPIQASFTYNASGSEVVLDPAKVRYVGAAGERWVGWDPVGKSPIFHIKDANTGKVLVDAVFPGSC